MARFSQRMINNMVIFAMLIMIALFNFHVFLPKQDTSTSSTLLPDDVFVLKIDFPEYSIERVANTFVYKSYQNADADPLAQVQAWSSLYVEPAEEPDIKNSVPYVVTVWLAGQPEGYVFAFYNNVGSDVYIKYNQQWFATDTATATQLIGEWE